MTSNCQLGLDYPTRPVYVSAMEASRVERHAFLDFSRLHRSEYIGFAGAAVLLLSLWLPWFETDAGNPNARINGQTGDFTAWETFGSLDWLLVAACSAPFVLAWIIARGHELTWRPGEITTIVGVTALVLILLNGVVLGKPGGPDTEISFDYGYLLGLLGAGGIGAGGVLRQAEGARERKPPGAV
jgi:hypothetical protein